MDCDGYPDETDLETIRKWDHTDFDGLIGYVQVLWKYPERIVSADSLSPSWYISTGGWSGNERLIRAMQYNEIWWSLFWYKSRVGGHYWFRDRKREERTE